MNTEAFQKTVRSHNGVLVVETWAEWCGPCKMTRPILHQLAEEFKGKVTLLEVDADQSPDLLRSLRVMAIPTMLVYRDGKEILRQTGAKSAGAYRSLFEQLAQGAAPTVFPLTAFDRVLRSVAGAAFIYFGLNPTNVLLLVIGGILLFSAIYDRCPIWRALTGYLKGLRS